MQVHLKDLLTTKQHETIIVKCSKKKLKIFLNMALHLITFSLKSKYKILRQIVVAQHQSLEGYTGAAVSGTRSEQISEVSRNMITQLPKRVPWKIISWQQQ